MKKLVLKIFAILFGVFALLFGIYFFNLDMKFVAYVVDPILKKNYDRIPRKQYV